MTSQLRFFSLLYYNDDRGICFSRLGDDTLKSQKIGNAQQIGVVAGCDGKFLTVHYVIVMDFLKVSLQDDQMSRPN